MTTMAKVTINWSGFPGGPGYTNLYFRDFTVGGNIDQGVVDGAVSKTDAFLTAVRPLIPSTITVGVNSTVEEIEDTTGALVSFYTGTPAAAAVGSGGTAYAGPAGAVISWYTNVVRNSRRIRGRTFIVPAGTGSFDTDGTITSTRLANLVTAATGITAAAGAGDLGVWARPTSPGATDGVWAVVASYRVPDRAAILTSRRD
jgi:hypothetical protein